MKYKVIAGALILMFAWLQEGNAQVFERTRHESKSFKVYDNTKLEIYNKYGNIHLFTWDKDSVHVEIELEVKASKESKADKIFEYIDFEFSDSKYYIIVRTNFRQNQGSFWSELSDLANTVFSGNNKAQIDYNVYLPADMNVKLENKFGNIYCTDHKGKFEANLSNGDFKANDLEGETELNLSFGNAGINYLQHGTITGSYLEMEIGKSDELFIESKSSTYNMKKIGAMKIQSRRDKFFVDEIVSCTGVSSFSNLTITDFSKLLQLKTEYGEIKLKGINPGFSKIDVNASYTDVILQVGAVVNCLVNVNYSESTGIYYPDAYTGLEMKKAEQKGEPSVLSGIIGNEPQNNSKIEITIQSGKVAFQEEIQLF